MKRILAVSALGLALLALQPASAWFEPARFDKDQKTEATKIPNLILSRLKKEVGPLLKAGKIETATNILMILLPKTDRQVVQLIDQHLTGLGLPAGSKLFTDRVLRRVDAGLVDMDTAPTTTELALLVPELVERTDRVIASAQSNQRVTGQESVPDDWNEEEKFFWDFHVMKNELDSASRLGEFGQTISKKFLKSRSKNRDSKLIEMAQRFPLQIERVESIRQQLVQQEAIYRQQQMINSIDQIKTATDFKNQFVGMTSLVSAQQFFQDFFAASDPEEFSNDVLSTDEFEVSVNQQISEMQKSKTELLYKVQRFQQGLHWWFRGRYGMGTQANGLLKPQVAMQSPQAMFGLHMPRTRPRPSQLVSDNESYPTVPDYQRRHFHNWSVGNQEIVTTFRAWTTTKRNADYKETTYLNRFY